MTISTSMRLAAAALAGLLAAGGVWWVLNRPASSAELLSALPDRDGATLYVDVSLARRAGILRYLSGPPAAQDAEYRLFVEATKFDYAHDLDGLAVRFVRDGGVWIAASGRFDTVRLAEYAASRGGRCVRGICTMPGSAPEKQISWLEPTGKILSMAVAPDPLAAALSGGGKKPGDQPPLSPVWLHLPAVLLSPGEGFPPGVSALLSALEGAREASFWIDINAQGVVLRLAAPFPEAEAARSSAGKLEKATGLLKKLLARESPQAAAGFGGILASGQFRAEGNVVNGSWPVNQAFLKELVP